MTEKNHTIIDTTQTVTGGNPQATGNPVINCISWDEDNNPDYDFHAGHGYEDGLIAIASDTAATGYIYDPVAKTFTNPNQNTGVE